MTGPSMTCVQIPDPFASPEALASLPQEHAEELLEQLDCGLLETVLQETVLEGCFRN